MASLNIHENCKIAPPSATATHVSLPLTFFDLFWLKFHPVERIFFYSLPPSHSNPSFFFEKIAPKLKTSLSLTLQHFLPLAGNIVWPSDSPKPIIQFNPDNNDGVSFILAQCNDANFNKILEHNSPLEAIQSRIFVPNLESNDSFASVISLQITLFPNIGFSIGISTHHAVLDGKSSTMFIKAWASICKTSEKSLPQSLIPDFSDRNEIIKDPKDLGSMFINNWIQISSHFDKSNERSMKIMAEAFQPIVKESVRATFELTRGDLDNINKRVLSKWNTEPNPIIDSPKPKALSTFVLTCAYITVCIAKAIQEAESNDEKVKFAFSFSVDCRARLEEPIPENYFGNCVSNRMVGSDDDDFIKEDGVVIIAKKIYGTIKKMDKRVLEGFETLMFRMMAMVGEGVKVIGVAGSTKFGVYESDFGWGRPAKVEITSVDRGLTIGMTESKDGKGGVEVGLVLNKNVMTLFHTFFHAGLSSD